MTLSFAFSTLVGYLFNRHITFRAGSKPGSSAVRYVSLYLLVYLTNWLILTFFVDVLQMWHLVVQGCAVVVLAIGSFFVQRTWVFRGTT